MHTEKIDVNHFLYLLLGKQKRRKEILRYWHDKEVKNVHEFVYEFIDTILHDPIQLSLYSNHLCVFQNCKFPISYSWLTNEELNYVERLFEDRMQYFETRHVTMDGQCALTGYRTFIQFSIHRRREIVRDYCWMGMSNPTLRMPFLCVLVYTLQCMKVRRKQYDAFVHQMHFALQGHKNVNDLICVY